MDDEAKRSLRQWCDDKTTHILTVKADNFDVIQRARFPAARTVVMEAARRVLALKAMDLASELLEPMNEDDGEETLRRLKLVKEWCGQPAARSDDRCDTGKPRTFEVVDAWTGDRSIFDPSRAQHLGSFGSTEGDYGIDELPEWLVFNELFRYPDGTCVLVKVRQHVESDLPCDAEIETLAEGEAVRLLLGNGLRVPSDLQRVAEQIYYKPTPAAPPTAEETPPEPPKPHWDAERRELRFNNRLVKRYRQEASNQTAVLAAFEEERWPARIDDPLPPKVDVNSSERLRETVRSLNNAAKRSISFELDGTGEGVLWTPISLDEATDDIPF